MSHHHKKNEVLQTSIVNCTVSIVACENGMKKRKVCSNCGRKTMKNEGRRET